MKSTEHGILLVRVWSAAARRTERREPPSTIPPNESSTRIRRLAKLGRRDREILELSFELNGGDPLSPTELAERIGLSRGYALQLRSDALKRLRKHMEGCHDPTPG
jgi:DNA-directed RNA polymerase specialized sigma subunit